MENCGSISPWGPTNQVNLELVVWGQISWGTMVLYKQRQVTCLSSLPLSLDTCKASGDRHLRSAGQSLMPCGASLIASS
jgi:hypothetical protein